MTSEMNYDLIIRYFRRQYLVDVTEIFRQINREKKIRYFKIGYLIILFVFSLFWYCAAKSTLSSCSSPIFVFNAFFPLGLC